MTFTPADPASVNGFLIVVVGVMAALPAGTYWANRRLGRPAFWPAVWAAGGLLAWVGSAAAVVAAGLPAARPMPVVPLFIAVSVGAGVAFGLAPAGGRLAAGLPLWALAGFQAFRLPLELVLHAWAAGGTVPRTMTWDGQNLDVVSGAVALAAVPLAARWRPAAWAADVVGVALLANVLRVAAMSSPLPFGWGVDPPLQLPLHLPYALIVPVCVGGAAAGHVVLTRALLGGPAPPPPADAGRGEH